MQKIRNKAFLVIVQPPGKTKAFLESSYQEIRQLTESASIRIMGALQAVVAHPSPSSFVRSGKLEELKQQAKSSGANVLIFNVDLTPVQARNIEAFIKIPPVDRTGLILEIFGRRAKSSEGKLQVELARLNYTLPRLGGLGGVMSRLGGGIGTRGPGEQELEWDRRKIRNRIQRVKEELKKVHKHRNLLRAGRHKKNLMTVALVGYTNAGKSTLLNTLTGAGTYVEDKLFATLDPKTRIRQTESGPGILFVDTVGFLKDLPHSLVEAFHATLEEVSEADFLVHVLDIADPHAEQLKQAVEEVLVEIGAGEKPFVLALNKSDLAAESALLLAKSHWPAGILISAKENKGINELLAGVRAMMQAVPAYSSRHPETPVDFPENNEAGEA